MVVQQLTRIIKTYYIGFQDSFSSRLCRRKSYLGPVNWALAFSSIRYTVPCQRETVETKKHSVLSFVIYAQILQIGYCRHRCRTIRDQCIVHTVCQTRIADCRIWAHHQLAVYLGYCCNSPCGIYYMCIEWGMEIIRANKIVNMIWVCCDQCDSSCIICVCVLFTELFTSISYVIISTRDLTIVVENWLQCSAVDVM